MTITALREVSTTTLDANGNGTVTLTPDVGEYWAPLLIAVATTTSLTPVPYCAVYHGSPGVAPSNSQFIDDTFTGNADSSSVISGTNVQYGEAIIAVFRGGTPGDTASVTVYGQTSDIPSNLSLGPQVPGTRFSGHAATEIMFQDGIKTSPISVLIGQPININAGTAALNLPGGPFGIGANITDVRQFTSYNIMVNTITSGALPGGVPQTSQLTLTWYADPAGTFMTYQDSAQWFNNDPGFNLGQAFFQDQHHGPYFQARLTNNSVSNNMSTTYSVQHSTRTEVAQEFGQQGTTTGVLAYVNTIGIGAGVTVQVPCPLRYGRASWKLENLGANPGLVYNIYYGNLPIIEQFILAAGTNDRREVILPKRALRIEVGGPAGGTSYKLNVVTQFDKTG